LDSRRHILSTLSVVVCKPLVSSAALMQGIIYTPHNGVFNSQSFQDTPKIKTPIGGVLAFASTRPRPASATLLLSVEIYLISSK